MSRAADILLRLGDTTPIVPTNGQISFYAKSNGIFYSLNSDGVETPLGGGGIGTVTSIDVSGGATGLTTIGGPVTSSGTITLSGTLFETHGGTGISTYTAGDMLYASDVNTLSKRAIGTDGQVLTVSGGIPTWSTPATSGSVTSISITSNNGFAGTVADSTTTPAITISTTVTGMIKGNGAAISAAVSGLDYSAGTSALSTGLLKSTTTTGELTIATANDLNTTFGTQTANYIYAAPNGSAGNPAFRAIVAADIPTLNQNTTGTAANVTEIVTELHGGTGTSSYVTGDILYASSTNTLSKRNIGTDGQVLTVSGGIPTWTTISGTGTVTSIEVSGGTTGLTTTGGPITTTGTITLGGTLTIENGGTGATTQQLALNALSGTQVANRVLRSDGTNVSLSQVALGSDVSGTLPISNGGTGATTQQLALNALSGTQVANRVLRSDGTNTSFAQVALESDVTGTLAISNGGSGATTAQGARTNFGATTVGSNVFTLTDPNAVTYIRINADNTVSTLSASSFRTAIGAGTSSTTGTVTSIDVSGGTTGLTTTGGPITESGVITLAGTLAISNGGTGATTQQAALNALSGTQVANRILRSDGTNVSLSQVSLGSDVTGTLSISNGGTGATTSTTAFNALAPSQTGNNGKFLTTDGTNTSWTTVSGTGTVTSIDISGGSTGLTTTGGPVTGSGIITLAGTLAIANGGTGATSASVARTNLGATTVGGNFFTLSDPSAITFPRINADNSVSALDAATFRTAIGAGTSSTAGTVTSVGMTVPAFLSISGSPITTSGTLAVSLSGTALPILNGGSGATTAQGARTNFGATTVGSNLFTLTNPSAVTYLRVNADNTVSALDATAFRTAIGAGTSSTTGTVTSVGISGGTTGLTTSGGPITSSGTITLAGTLAIANGGTGATTQSDAANAILPSQTGNTGKVLTTDGSTVSWTTVSGSGTVTSVSATGSDGVTVSGSPITTSGTISIGLGNITPINVAATGTVTGTNLSGTNTGDQTITLTGDVTGSGTGSFTTTLANSGVTAGVYGSSTEVPVITVDEKGRITNVSNTAISGTGSSAPEIVVWHYGSGGSGTFAPADVLYSQTSGVTATVTDAANCIATYSFTGKSNLPKSMTVYGQAYTTNTFSIKMTTSLPSASVVGGGTAAIPDLISGIFSASNIVTLQTRMSDVGASAGVGQRAWLIIVFGF